MSSSRDDLNNGLQTDRPGSRKLRAHFTGRFSWPASAPTPSHVILAAVALGAVAILFFHGFEIFNFTLSIDEELNLGGEDILLNIQQGRWGQALRILLLMPDTTAPVVSIGGGLMLYAGAFVLLIRQLEIQHWAAVAVASPLFFGFPTLVQALAFSDLVLALGIGSLLTIIALSAAVRMRFTCAALAVLLITVSVSLYQSLLFFAMVVFLADLVRRAWALSSLDRALLFRTATYAGIIVSSAALYALVTHLLLRILNLQLVHITQFSDTGLLGANSLRMTIEEILSLYDGTAAPFLHWAGYYQILIALCGLVLAFGLIRTSQISLVLALGIASLLAAMLVTPFLQHPLAGGHMPYWVLMSLPVATAVIALFGAELSPPTMRSYVLLPLAGLAAIQFSWISNRQYYAGHWALERDKAVANEIISRVQEVKTGRNGYLIAVIGDLQPLPSPLAPFVPYSTVGASFFEWDGGNAARIAGLLNLLSEAKFAIPHPVLYREAFEIAAAMPSWPAKGSIVARGDVIIVKLSESTPPQLERLCPGETAGICARYRH
jgi:hypothetical protein